MDAGFKATSVHTLKEARAALNRSEADILFLDIFLPDGNGLDSLSEIRETNPDIPIIVLTGARNDAHRRRSDETARLRLHHQAVRYT